jgi:acetolactate synthase regulatory subunit
VALALAGSGGTERPSAVPTTSPRRFRLRTTEAPDALPRVLTLLRRRGCDLVRVDYARADRHRPGHLQIVVEARGRPHRLQAWLLALVDVLDVEEE